MIREELMLEPEGGNFYKPHPLMIHSGKFWRCKHGHTGMDPKNWFACWICLVSKIVLKSLGRWT